MVNTLTPAFIITLTIYLFMGFHHDAGTGDASILNQLLDDITANFRLGFIPAIPMILVFYLLLRQTNPIWPSSAARCWVLSSLSDTPAWI